MTNSTKSSVEPKAGGSARKKADGLAGKPASSGRVKKARIDGRKAPHTKDRILDAAEALFVQRGYYGTSLRDISKGADVQLALTHYHFGSKEDLFRAVIDRRAEDNVAALSRSLDAAKRSAAAANPATETLLRAFLEPIVDHALRHGDGWRNYIRLLAQVANLPQDEKFIIPVNVHYDSVVADFVAVLREIYPDMPVADIHWFFHFVQATISHVLVESGMVDRQSGGLCKSSQLDTIVDRMVLFFTAGFEGVARTPR